MKITQSKTSAVKPQFTSIWSMGYHPGGVDNAILRDGLGHLFLGRAPNCHREEFIAEDGTVKPLSKCTPADFTRSDAISVLQLLARFGNVHSDASGSVRDLAAALLTALGHRV